MFYPQFFAPQQYFEAWRKMMSDHMTRLEALHATVEGAEEQNVAQASQAIDEAAKLMKAMLTYNHTLMTEWRKQSLEATKQATSMMTMNGGV